jgi:hypothetical protein
MAIGYGLGLAFQGTPKDYSELVRSREAAKQKAAAAKAAKEQTALDKLYERFTFSNKDRSYLPVHQDAASKTVNDVLDVFAEAQQSDTPNFTEVYRKVGQAMIDLNGYVSQKKYFDEINQDPYNRGFTVDEIQAIQTERDPNKLFDVIQKNGVGTSFNKENLMIGFRPSDKFADNTVLKQLEGYFQKLGESAYDPKEIIAVNDVKGTRYEYSGISKQAKDSWIESAAINPGSIREFEMTYKANNPDYLGMVDFSRDDIQKGYLDYLSKNYDKYVAPKLSAKSGRADYVPPTTTTEEEAVLDFTGYMEYDARNKKEAIPAFASFGFAPVSANINKPKGLIDVDTFLEISGGGGRYDFAQLAIVPVDATGKSPLTKKGLNVSDIKLKLATKGEYTPNGTTTSTEAYNFDPVVRQTAIQKLTNKPNRNALIKKVNEAEQLIKKFNSLPAAKRNEIYLKLQEGQKTLPELLGGGASSRGSIE